MNRRSFLTGAGGVALSNLLMGCSGQNRQRLSLRVLNGSIPPQIVGEYRKHLRQAAIAGSLEIAIEPQLQSAFNGLQAWTRNGQADASASDRFGWVPFIGKRSKPIPDLVTIGNYWLEKAVQQGLIQPFDLKLLSGWQALPPAWKEMATRSSATPTEQRLWGAPYRGGNTVIAYRQDIFKEKGLPPPTDWSDLWRSDLRGHISLLDQPREVIGLTLKKLGQSYNTANLETVPTLQGELMALHQQVKLYSSDAYLQPLLLGDTWLAVCWSTDLLPLTQRNQKLAVVVPKSGTALWADLWVRPAVATPASSSLAADWISFCWRPEIASQLSLISRAMSPVVLTTPVANLPIELRQNPVLLPAAATQAASEFLQPLDRATVLQYQVLWQRLRQVSG
ncbi:extracellular solute-binding protein [Leptolyngbya sp. FACHB-321]|nr:extracellular solute-binding protein [Leptolyngbya sp. FACHB-321]